ncbi:hypothetical protein ACFT7S_27625 [Streptomyces sp. NPDC057136]
MRREHQDDAPVDDTRAFPIDPSGVEALAALKLPQPPVDPSTLTD